MSCGRHQWPPRIADVGNERLILLPSVAPLRPFPSTSCAKSRIAAELCGRGTVNSPFKRYALASAFIHWRHTAKAAKGFACVLHYAKSPPRCSEWLRALASRFLRGRAPSPHTPERVRSHARSASVISAGTVKVFLAFLPKAHTCEKIPEREKIGGNLRGEGLRF